MNKTIKQVENLDSTIEDIKKLMTMKEYEYKMLSKTFSDMIDSDDCNKESLDSISDSLKRVLGELSMLKNDYTDAMVNSVTYTTYDNDKNCKEPDEKTDTDPIGLIMSNNFIVHLEAFGIKPHLVNEVVFNRTKNLSIGICDTVVEFMGRMLPLIDVLTTWGSEIKFDMSIERLDEKGVVIYTENYHDCIIEDINRSTLEYKTEEYDFNFLHTKMELNTSPSMIFMCVRADSVEYSMNK